MKTNLISSSFSFRSQNSPTRKILLTFFLLFLFRLGNAIPLTGIDQEAVKKSFLQLENRNSLTQLLNMYSGSGGKTLLSSFSLGIIPFINASILVDLLATLVPNLEKLQSEEGEAGRQKLNFYKKAMTFLFAIFQSGFLVFYLKPYFYLENFSSLFLIGLELVTGSMLVVWISNLIDTKGIGNGTSLIIFTNIVLSLCKKDLFGIAQQSSFLGIELSVLLFLFFLICASQTASFNIPLVSARQLSFLEKIQKDKTGVGNQKNSQLQENGLRIKLNQAGIFPIIIASNLLPFLSFLSFQNALWVSSLLYYVLIISFNYFYTLVFWDPEKIAEQLRKSSVSIVNVRPGTETISYLEKVVQSSSLLGGIYLCLILFLYESFKKLLQSALLNELNISSLIILIGVTYETGKTIRGLYQAVFRIPIK
jgi:preprotein translocase subunit SecY